MATLEEAPDHPHILLLRYRGWQEAGIRWVRLNPDTAYARPLLPRPPVDAPAGAQVDCQGITELLEPGSISDRITRAAAVLELSDRRSSGTGPPIRDEVLAGRR